MKQSPVPWRASSQKRQGSSRPRSAGSAPAATSLLDYATNGRLRSVAYPLDEGGQSPTFRLIRANLCSS